MDANKTNYKETIQNTVNLGYANLTHHQILMVKMLPLSKILSSLCFNSFLNQKIHIEGIKDVDDEDIKNSINLGTKLNC